MIVCTLSPKEAGCSWPPVRYHFWFPLLHLRLTRHWSPNDQQIRTQIDTIIHGESAFDGMSITPTVAHGVVTLSGTVSSQAAKVLASTEIANVEGIKTVLNNLNVVGGGSQVSRPAIIPMQPPPTHGFTGPKVVSVAQNTLIPIRITEEINTKTATANDTFHGTTASAVIQNGYTVIPTGTPVTGRVVEAKTAGHLTGMAELSLELTSVRLNTPTGAQDVSVVTTPLSSKTAGRGANTAAKTGGGAAVGAIIGALAGGGSGAAIGAASGGALGAGTNAVTRGKEIDLKPEQLLQFHTGAPLDLTVSLKNGQQSPVSVPSPALAPRPDNTGNATSDVSPNRRYQPALKCLVVHKP